MTLPANIRVNVPAPFPATVKGLAPVTVGKANGIYTLGISFIPLGQQTPPSQNYPTDFVLVYDSIAQTYFKMSLQSLGSATSGIRPQRLVTAGPITVAGNDQVLNLKLGATFTTTLPSYAARSGLPLTLCDVTKLAGVTFFQQNFNAAAGETIDGNASVSITVPGQSITLLPMNDGTSVGWKQI